MVTVNKLGVLSVAKLSALFFGLIGLVRGIAYAIAYKTEPASVTYAFAGNPTFTFGYWAILVFPIIHAALYFVLGALSAWLYNIFARWLGGVDVDLEPAKEVIEKKKR